MNKQYRLLKDFPGLEAGAIFRPYSTECNDYVTRDQETEVFLKQHLVENNPDWFAPIVTTCTIEIRAEMGFNSAFGALLEACSDVGIKIPTLTPTEGEAIDLLAAKGYTILTTGEDWITNADLEKCWDAARMEDHFSRTLPRPAKYATFQDYMDRKPK